MRVLLSTIGSRGEVQPLVGLACQLRALGQEVRLCIPPDFRAWIEGLGFAVTPIGPELKPTGKVSAAAAPITPEKRKAMIEETVATQFDTLARAADGVDVIVGATALQIAAPSIAEKLRIPYHFVAYCPVVLPSVHHAPPVFGMLGDTPATSPQEYPERWARDAERWNASWGGILNTHRAALGLPEVADVRRYVLTDRPWLACDPLLGPWPEPADGSVSQTGAWIFPDDRALPPELETFLSGGEPPVYFGFGSLRAPPDLSRSMITAARAIGRRAVVSSGWADLAAIDDQRDCLVIGDVNHGALFGRVVAVVHHGGAGTTTAAALAGAPQVVIPQMFDQFYWAERVRALGIGAVHPGLPTAESLTRVLSEALRAEVGARARALGPQVRGDGARAAAQRILSA